jgi:hypothetical protein
MIINCKILMKSQEITFPASDRGIETPIGLLGPHNRLVCSVNLQDRSTRYYIKHSQLAENISNLVEKRTRWAFTKLKGKKGDRSLEESYGGFLPGELLRGNDRVIP